MREGERRSAVSAGQVGRRRALPGSRAVAGGFAVAAAVVLVLAAFASRHSTSRSSWVVARTGIPAGTPITASELTTRSLGLGSAAAGAFARPADLVGRTLAVSVPAGQLIEAGEVTGGSGASSSLRPVPVTVAGADLADLADGDLVDVLSTAGTPARTTIVVRGADVVSTVQPSSGVLGSGGDDVVTLGVADLAEVEALVNAEHAGTVDVVVGTRADGRGLGAAPGPGSSGVRAG